MAYAKGSVFIIGKEWTAKVPTEVPREIQPVEYGQPSCSSAHEYTVAQKVDLSSGDTGKDVGSDEVVKGAWYVILLGLVKIQVNMM